MFITSHLFFTHDVVGFYILRKIVIIHGVIIEVSEECVWFLRMGINSRVNLNDIINVD